MMLRIFFKPRTASFLILLISATISCAQSYPSKPLRMVAGEPGGGNDFGARLISSALSTRLGQQVVIDNRGAASGAIAAETVANAPADGYTLLFYGSNIWLLPLLRAGVHYDPIKDFAPVTLAATSPNVLIAHPSLAAHTVKELIALAKSRPGELNYATGGSGSSTHLSAELLKSMANIDLVRIPYKGNGPALNAVIAGQVPLMFATAGASMPQIKAGRVKALAVTSAQPSTLFPGLPTVASGGLPGYELSAMYGVFAPTGTSRAIITRLNTDIVHVLQEPAIKEKFFLAGVESLGTPPADLATAVKEDMRRMGKVIREANIHDE